MAEQKKKIEIKPSERGSLRKAMHAKKGQKLSLKDLHSELAAAKKRHDVAMEKKIVFAINFHKGKG